VASGQVFYEYFGFSCQNYSFQQLLHLTITRGRYNKTAVAAVPSGPSLDSTPQYSDKEIRTIFYCLSLEIPPTWRCMIPYLYPPGTGSPSYTAGSGFHFRRLLRFAGLRWRYLNPLPHRMIFFLRPNKISIRTLQDTLYIRYKD
jgi:hypothetical protein